MKTIQLSQGKEALVDDDRFWELNQFKWYYHKGYAIRKLSSGSPQISMEHIVYGIKVKLDHIDGNSLNNQRLNLVPTTHSLNIQRGRLRNVNSSGYRGVNFAHGKWQARIGVNGKRVYIGLFNSLEEAARMYDKKAFEVFGGSAELNFPNENPAKQLGEKHGGGTI